MKTSKLTLAQKNVVFEVLCSMGFTEPDKLSDENLVSFYNWYVSMPYNLRKNEEQIGIRLNSANAELAAISRSEVHETIRKSKYLISIVRRLQDTITHLNR